MMAHRVTVVIADDQPRARQALRALLATWSPAAIVAEAGDGAQAVQVTQHTHPDVALLDVRMPGLSGIQVAQIIRATCPATRIIALSIDGDCEEQTLAAGADAFLNKADAPQQLLPLIARLMTMEV
jgi:DNA-binding NarL/FixJ family response regulator